LFFNLNRLECFSKDCVPAQRNVNLGEKRV